MAEHTLKANNLKKTRSRKIILSILEQSDQPMTAEELYAVAHPSEHISLSTIYRTLATLTERGILLKSIGQDGKSYYQCNSHQHKHHLTCTICGTIIPIERCPLEELALSLEQQTGYLITGHHLEFLGVCPSCAAEHK